MTDKKWRLELELKDSRGSTEGLKLDEQRQLIKKMVAALDPNPYDCKFHHNYGIQVTVSFELLAANRFKAQASAENIMESCDQILKDEHLIIESFYVTEWDE